MYYLILYIGYGLPWGLFCTYMSYRLWKPEPYELLLGFALNWVIWPVSVIWVVFRL